MRRRLLEFRSGGWLLLLATLLVLLVGLKLAAPLWSSTSRAIGDGDDAGSYGFDLGRLGVARETLVASGVAKDMIPALGSPDVMPGAEVAAFNEQQRGKYLVGGDRVIGVTVGDESRAYPLRVLNWHEVVNDTLGGVPIAVTYNPLCDSIVVFDRRVGEETLEFGVSGLLHDSNLLMFDRRTEPAAESLWSQLLGRAVAGPAFGRSDTLIVLPASVATWALWLESRPDTTVLRPDAQWAKRYRRNPYGNYFLTGKPRYPLDPLPPADGRPWMDRVLVLETGSGIEVLPLGPRDRPTEAIRRALPPGVRLETAPDDPLLSVVLDPDAAVRTRYSLWLAWYALRED